MLPILFIPALTLLFISLFSLGFALYKRRWRRLISILIAPFFLGITWLPIRLGYDWYWVRFHIVKPEYIATISRNHEDTHTWNWGSSGGVPSVQTTLLVVYDKSDSILKRVEQDDEVRAMGNHFYLVKQIFN